MAATEASKIQQFARRLALRQAELNALLNRAAQGDEAAGPDHDVIDFKDLAAGDARAVIDQAASAQALQELVQVASALRRLREGSFGRCLDCDEPIAEQRLLALPAAAYCASCQAVHERRLGSAFARRAPGGGAAHRLGFAGA